MSDEQPTDSSQPTPHSPTLAADNPQPDDAERIILRVSRHLQIKGYLELEDDQVIVIRTLRGEIRSYPRSRILQMIRLVTPEPGGQRGIVLLSNGQRREGIIIEDAFDHVIVEIEGIRTTIHRDVVDEVILEPTFEQQYEAFVASIRPGMYDRQLVLCQWLFEHRRYGLARKHLIEILEEKEMPEARRMLRLVDAQITLMEHSTNRESRPESKNAETLPPHPLSSHVLLRDEVNLIRVYEIDFDAPPRVALKPDTIRRLIERYGTDKLIPAEQSERAKLFRADPLDVVRLMFDLRARDLYGDIEVLSEPRSMNFFRQRVHDTWLMNNCASCHSGPMAEAGRFFLHRGNARDERVRYTNFLILERLEVNPDWPLINYEDPEMSLIVQYGMPRTSARLPHPDVRGWKPVFTRGAERMREDTIAWIRAMMQPRPEYPVEFDPARIVSESVDASLRDE